MTRIVGGRAGGRGLRVPPGSATRPTADRAREGLFNTLAALVGDLAGARFLDLYAGSGAVGLEALSRGAVAVLFVESAPKAARTLRDNVAAVDLPGAAVRVEPVARVVAEAPDAPYDVVFADPPYATTADELAAVLRRLVSGGWLAPGAVVVVERASRDGEWRWPPGIEPVRARRYGEATLWYGRAASATDQPDQPDQHRSGGHVRRVICPGSFDPITLGHLDIIERASRIYDEVVVVVGANAAKHGLFTVDERIELIREATAAYGNVRTDFFKGLLVDYCRDHEIPVIVKGLRAVSDFDYELQMAQMNRDLAGVETLFIATNPLYSFLSSSLVKEVATYGGDVSGLVPDNVHRALAARLTTGAER